MSHMLIIGGGLAGGTAAEALRKEGFDGDITVVAAEPHLPYQRPPLSKGYLAGNETTDAVILHPAQWYAERGIRLITGVAATRLDPAAHAVELDDGRRLSYDGVLLATGATPRTIPLPGAQLPGVMTLRRLDDSDARAAVGLECRQPHSGPPLVLSCSVWSSALRACRPSHRAIRANSSGGGEGGRLGSNSR